MRHRLWALALACAVSLAGCAAIPTSGPIQTGDVALNDPGPPIPVAMEPPRDGTPETIVYGFLAASAAGLSDQFVGARKYLTYQAASTWVPTSQLLVYPSTGKLTVDPESDGKVVVRVPVQGSLDDAGVYTEAPPGGEQELAMELTQNVDGQWRISSLQNVVVMSSIDFTTYYRQVPVYFASKDATHLVPDVRWVPASGAASAAARALLAGPSPWLRDAVVSGAPEGTRLGSAGVEIGADQTATVDLSAAAGTANADQRNLLIAQLTATLSGLPAVVSSVEVSAGGGKPWEATGRTDMVRNPEPDTGPYVIAGNALQVLDGDKLTPVEGVAPLPVGAADPALSQDGEVRVVVVDGTRLLRLPADGSPPVQILAGPNLLSPSIDRFDWIWTARSDQPGLVAVSASGDAVPVSADWLAGSQVISIAVARSGSRIAVVHQGDDGRPVIDVAAILRDGSGRPQRLGPTFQVGQSMNGASQVEWMDESTLAVLGLSGSLVVPTTHMVPVGGQTDPLPLVDGTVTIAAGRGARALYLADSDGQLLWRQGAAWVPVASGVQDPVFPG
ncbi:LpqB family beta-propeller domain-containing protein [Isoptericola sp. b441]|uniref:LpqB family beta-propeller domain-containing protein n=1 Tax=Actinotalea lenta TaxID=3064654 RepID=A0ABT9DCG2_9CELL|nr:MULTISPECIES: LpqB family beta-propeller domain-containing protein [unclassified Isoptericola]MDO8108590.1 LpqB family beta-propeller domain-containing protein [Isoptericola sp. b441]MDO8120000.1 LpqB family beta-propeller domain-containing protein [Isoptericola sp. b490]